ncbi:MAG: bacillithiol biosynthesis deacetylase BshB1 [Ignavibacteriales bacterium]|nr:bacillithiol biosynthesis deacetylase BshB1 [Ignavibacteriales bacterium]
MAVDVLAIASHPDDLELSCGGTIAKLVKEGRSVAMADATQGELGTRGTKEIRAKEAEQAAKTLGAGTRRNLLIPDGSVEANPENLQKVITLIRELQPKILLIPHSIDRHPDHFHTHQLCKEAWFFSGLAKFETKKEGRPQKAFRPDNYFEFMQWYEFQPSFIVDISDTWDIKLEAIRQHSSQFHDPKSKEPETRLSRPEFLELVEVRARNYGRRIGVKFAEPFFSYIPIGIKSVFDLVMNKG